MDKVKYHIPQFILWVLFWILVIFAIIYLSGLGDKIDKIYTYLDINSTCTNITE